MDYEIGLSQLKAHLNEITPHLLAEFETLDDQLRRTIADEQKYGKSDNLSHRQAQIVDALNQLSAQQLGIDFTGFCLGAESPVSDTAPNQSSLHAWQSGDEVTLRGQLYVLQSPVKETQMSDKSFIHHKAKAWQPDTDRLVWLKQIVVEQKAQAAKEALNLLKAESRLLVQLENKSHGDFPRLIDLISNENKHTLIYTYTAGDSFSTVFGNLDTPLDKSRTLRLLNSIQPVCSMLHVLHQAKRSHRQLTPDTLMLLEDRSDYAVLQELGLAFHLCTPGEGSELYRAPEQDSLDASLSLPGPYTDIYQLGAILYHFLTGQLPISFLGEIEPPSTWNDILTTRLDNTLIKALAQIPAERWSDIREFGRALSWATHEIQNNLRGIM